MNPVDADIEPEESIGVTRGNLMGTFTDVNDHVIPNATVVLNEIEGNAPRTILTTETGKLEFHDVTPGIPYQLSISASSLQTGHLPRSH